MLNSFLNRFQIQEKPFSGDPLAYHPIQNDLATSLVLHVPALGFRRSHLIHGATEPSGDELSIMMFGYLFLTGLFSKRPGRDFSF